MTRRLGPIILKLVIESIKHSQYIRITQLYFKKTHLGPKQRFSHRLGLFSQAVGAGAGASAGAGAGSGSGTGSVVITVNVNRLVLSKKEEKKTHL